METTGDKKNFWGGFVMGVLCVFVAYLVFSQADFSKFRIFGNWAVSRIFNAPPPVEEIDMGQFPNPRCTEDHGFGVCLGSIITPADFRPYRDYYSLGVIEIGNYKKPSQQVRFKYATTNDRGQPIARVLIWTFSGENAKFPLTVQLRDGNGTYITEAGLSIRD